MFSFSSLTLSRLESLAAATALPGASELKSYLKKATKALQSESVSYRPVDSTGAPGSLLFFDDTLTTVIVPDLHARSDFLLAVLRMTLPTALLPAGSSRHSSQMPVERCTVFEALQRKQVRVVCLGDALHSESRQRERWIRAYNAFIQGNKVSIPMVEEMSEGLSLISMICALKSSFPEHFHFLKGNHENILNQISNGNHAFKKFASEGEMVYEFMKQVYGNSMLQLYDAFEKSLPLLVQTPWYVASHAEPNRIFSRQEIIDAYQKDDVIFGLTWTPNDAADPGNVPAMLSDLVPDNSQALWFAGHRPVIEGKYNLRAGGRFVQLHNPLEMNVALVPGKASPFNLATQIVSVAQYAPGKRGGSR